MTTEQKASSEQVSQQEPVSPETKPIETVGEQKGLTKEEVQQMIAEATVKAVQEAKELGRRELQSAQDRNKAELTRMERRAKLAETTLGAAKAHLSSDPDVARELELAELRAKEQGRLTLEQEEQQAQYQAQVVQRFQEDMTQFVTGLGIDTQDQRIDWASDAPDLLTRQRRILDSVTKVQKENVETLRKSLSEEIKKAAEKIKKDLGGEDNVNSVATGMSGGVSSDGIPTDMTKFRSWVANLPQTEYEKLAPKINEMLRAGKIK